MKRRVLYLSLGLIIALAGLTGLLVGQSFAREGLPVFEDPDPRGGFNLEPPKKYLFMDDRHIEPGELVWRSPEGEVIALTDPDGEPVAAQADSELTPHGVRIQAMPARKEILPSIPPYNIIYDDGLYRAWDSNLVTTLDSASTQVRVTYAESKDGYDWNRREIDTLPFPGMTHGGNGGFFIDHNGPASERYKGVIFGHVDLPPAQRADYWARYLKVHPYYRDPRLSKQNLAVIYGVVSADGIDWTILPEPLMISKGDTHITVTFDPYLGKYVMYSRLYPLRRRMVGRAESDDFRNWTPMRPVVWAELDEPLSMDVYTNCYTTYPGEPSQLLMLPMFYDRYTETADVRMYSSLDGVTWYKLPGEPILNLSTEPGEWPGEYMYVTKNLIPLRGDRVGVRFTEQSRPHKYPRWKGIAQGRGGYAWWPKDRLAAVVADQEGEFFTFKMKATGRQLRLNARIHGAGEIRVGIFTANPNAPDRPIHWSGGATVNPDDPDRPLLQVGRTVAECDPLTGDSANHLVTWQGNPDLKISEGEVIGLHFKMRAAELFAFEWE